MRQLNTYEKSRMISTENESFNDVCVIHTATITISSLGEQTKSWADSSSIACGYNPSNAFKSYRGQVVTLDCDAILRLPLTQAISTNQEVTTSNIRYKVDGVTIGKTVKIVTLKRVDANEQ